MLLGVNVDHCATLRQARYREYGPDSGQMVEPDPVAFAQAAERAGADGITVHLREDRRHIQEADVERMRECIATRLNLEMAATAEMVAFAKDIRPDSACIVPESREEVTTEGGLDAAGQRQRLAGIIDALKDAGIVVSLFIDPDSEQIRAAAELGAPVIELHTGAFANHFFDDRVEKELETLRRATDEALQAGLIVNAGHGISYVNIRRLRAFGSSWHELNIGHSIVSRALFTGVDEAVREMKRRLHETW